MQMTSKHRCCRCQYFSWKQSKMAYVLKLYFSVWIITVPLVLRFYYSLQCSYSAFSLRFAGMGELSIYPSYYQPFVYIFSLKLPGQTVKDLEMSKKHPGCPFAGVLDVTW